MIFVSTVWEVAKFSFMKYISSDIYYVAIINYLWLLLHMRKVYACSVENAEFELYLITDLKQNDFA